MNIKFVLLLSGLISLSAIAMEQDETPSQEERREPPHQERGGQPPAVGSATGHARRFLFSGPEFEDSEGSDIEVPPDSDLE